MQAIPRAALSLGEPEQCCARYLPTPPVDPHNHSSSSQHGLHHRMTSKGSVSDQQQSPTTYMAGRASPTRLAGESNRSMVPPPNPFAVAPLPVARITSLAAPNLPQLGPRSPGYSAKPYSHSASPSTASGSLSDLHTLDSPTFTISPTHTSSATLNAQKRAYRQRRKDPSCDACRERKVKCDATETSACSECSSRNHKCQFTKETNRRMSSIKQVQDLQTQIAELTEMNSKLRTKVSDKNPSDSRRTESKRSFSESERLSVPSQRAPVPMFNAFDAVRSNIRKHSRGVFRTPHQPQPKASEFSSRLPQLPPRADYAQLSRYYLDSIHTWYPLVHWPSFQRDVDEVYTLRTLEGTPREWVALFFSVLACGSLQAPATLNSVQRQGQAFFDVATQSLSSWQQELTVTHAQAALLCSIFAVESNNKLAGSMWLASAVRIAQELQITPEVDCWPIVDIETRRRLWWAIYVRDRQLSLDTGRQMLIHEDDCEIPLPSPVEDRYIQPQGSFRSLITEAPFTGSLSMIQMTRLHADVQRALKASAVPSSVVPNFDEEFRSKFSLLPDRYQVASSAPLEIAALPPIFTLLSAQFILHRRNLTPRCHPTERIDAVNRCTSIAQDTAKFISRTLHNAPKSEAEKSWLTRVSTIASHAVCMHLWRCILVLCFRGKHDAALMCLHFMRSVGPVRSVNNACGRNAVFFLDRLLDRVQMGHDVAQLNHDEEMMAYLSGDAQGSLEQSWIWAGTELKQAISLREPPRGDSCTPSLPGASPGPGIPACFNREDHHPWDDWGRIEHLIRQLLQEAALPRTTQQTTYCTSAHNPVKRVQMSSGASSAPAPPFLPSSGAAGISRISIANII